MDERILDSIESPADLRDLDPGRLEELSREIRDELVATVSRTGGHLAPNLGVVELTIGLHRALECPDDRLVWDVGHQSYVHKLLTGRRERFGSLRQYGGVCGFTKQDESRYDVTDAGHASDSISQALGMALARDVADGDETVAVVIGDGSLTGGMAFEALNHLGHLGTRMLVVLNDNEMSISPNVGALAAYLARARLDPRYTRLRDDVESRLARIPGFGAAMVAAGEAAKESIKQLVVPGMLFEELGLKYVGPIDGHDIATVESTINWAKRSDGPILVHAITRKGYGYTHAEDAPTTFHGVSPFSVETGRPNGSSDVPSYTKVFGDALLAEAERDERVCAITAAMRTGTGLVDFAERFPDRFYDVGIAEQHAVGLAAGLAGGGMKPVCAIYSTFLQRAYDQVIMDVALQDRDVVFCLDRAGVVGEDGPTHHGVFDLSYLRGIPGLRIMAPSDEAELVHMLHTALSMEGPVAIRYPRGRGTGVDLPGEPEALRVGEARVRRRGEDVALLGVGRMVGVAERAAGILDAEGVSSSVVDLRWVKPLDAETVLDAARTHRLLVTVEEGVEAGGVGSAVLELLAEHGVDVPVEVIGIPDCFVTWGAMEELLEEVGLTPDAVAGRAADRLERIGADADAEPARRRDTG